MKSNHLILTAKNQRNEKGLWSLIDIFLLTPAVYIVFSSLLFIALDPISATVPSTYFMEVLKFSSIHLGISFMVMVLSIWFVVKTMEHRGLKTLGFQAKKPLVKYGFGFLIGFIMISLTTLLILLSKSGQLNADHIQVSGYSALPTVLIMLVGWLIQGGAEEVLTRGFILPKLTYRYNLFFGVFISSCLFSLLHLGNPGMGWIPIMNLSLFGLFAALYSLYEESILGICGLHSAWNFFQGNVYGFLVSGTSAKGGSLMGIAPNEKTLLNGGDFGPDGGFIVSFVLVVGIIICIFYLIKKEKQGVA
jgi:membrane protease YdiL (CAAX protease family)